MPEPPAPVGVGGWEAGVLSAGGSHTRAERFGPATRLLWPWPSSPSATRIHRLPQRPVEEQECRAGDGAARSLRSCGDGPLTGRPALDGVASWALPVALRAVSLSRVYE